MLGVEQSITRKGDFMGKKGIDVSHHQGSIDFQAVKNSNFVEFVILREGCRMTSDSQFFHNVNGFRSVGIPILGLYHFIYATNKEDAKAEAHSFIDNIRFQGFTPDTGVYLFADFEYDSVNKAQDQYGITLTPVHINEIVYAFCDYCIAAGYENVGIYTNKDWYKNIYTKELLGDYHVWLADYTGGPDYPCLIQQYSNLGSIPGITGAVDLNELQDDSIFKINEKTSQLRLRSEMVKLAESWIGLNEADGSYKKIIDIFNSYNGTNIKMDYGWSWCACFFSALGIELDYTDIIPIEISCGRMVDLATKMGIWQEDDNYTPKSGDAILYDWDATPGQEDNTGWPDHIGIVTEVTDIALTVVEGNKSDAVGTRIIPRDKYSYIRGYITPKYDEVDGLESGKTSEEIADEIIAGLWNKGEKRKQLLEYFGYNYREVQDVVNAKLSGDKGTEEEISETCGFGEALTALKSGSGAIRRQSWPEKVKVMAGAGFSLRGNYFVIYKEDGSIELWNPTVSDCFAEDWEVHEE